MLHQQRRWTVEVRDDLTELAGELAEMHYPLRHAFKTPAGTLWVNDSLGEGSLQEYAVLRPDGEGAFRQVESVTVSWCSQDRVEELLCRADSGTFDEHEFFSSTVPADRLDFV